MIYDSQSLLNDMRL